MTLFAPGSTGWMIRHEMRLTWRYMIGLTGGKSRLIVSMIILVVVALTFGAIGGYASRLLTPARHAAALAERRRHRRHGAVLHHHLDAGPVAVDGDHRLLRPGRPRPFADRADQTPAAPDRAHAGHGGQRCVGLHGLPGALPDLRGGGRRPLELARRPWWSLSPEPDDDRCRRGDAPWALVRVPSGRAAPAPWPRCWAC